MRRYDILDSKDMAIKNADEKLHTFSKIKNLLKQTKADKKQVMCKFYLAWELF